MADHDDIEIDEGVDYSGSGDATNVSPAPDAESSQATQITAAPSLPSRGTLVVIEGRGVGQRFDVTDGKHILGRGNQAEFVLPDMGVSRQHAEIIAREGSVVVRDLGSGNGTLVNGVAVDEQQLYNGDEIELGEHVLRFEGDPSPEATLPRAAPAAPVGGPMQPAEGPPSISAQRRARRAKQQESSGGGKKFLVFVLLLAVVGGGGYVYLQKQKADEEAAVLAREAAANPVVPVGLQAQARFREGLNAFKDGQYPEALTFFEEALSLDANNQSAQKYMGAAKREIAASEALAEGRRLMGEKNLAGARTAFERVGAESLQQADAQSELYKLKEAEGAATLAEGDALLASMTGQPIDRETVTLIDAAIAKYQGVLEALPENAAARQALDRAKVQRVQAVAVLKRRGIDIQNTIIAKKEKVERAAKVEVRAAIEPGIAQFESGNFDGAVAHFDSKKGDANPKIASIATRFSAAIKKFAPAYDRGMKADQRDPGPGVRDLEQALEGAATVSPGGTIHKRVKQKLGKMLYLQGRIGFNSGKFSTAFKAWNRCMKVDPSNVNVKNGLRDLEQAAKTLYLTAYQEERINAPSAQRKYKKVLQMTAPEFDYHGKAQRRLDKLQPQ